MTVAQIAQICNAVFEGDGSRSITSANTLERATEADLAFAESERYRAAAAASRAGCLILPPVYAVGDGRTVIRVRNPRLQFATVVQLLCEKPQPAPGRHASAVIDTTATVPNSCRIGPFVTIGANTKIGENCVIGAGSTVGEHVSVGDNSILHARVTLYDHVHVGERVILHAGVVLGADGFGFYLAGDHYEKFPQVGVVLIEDDVEIGANACIDRAALGVTRIGKGSKIDNLVHVAHNCDIGQHVVIAAQTGFSGSATVGDYAVIGGQVGVGDKARIDGKAVVASKSGVLTGRRVPAGEVVWGIPARPLRQHLRNLAHVARLPETQLIIEDLTKRVKALEESVLGDAHHS